MASKSLELILELIVKDAGGDLAKITAGMDAIIKKANDLKSTAQLKDLLGAERAKEQINALGVAMQKLVDFRTFSHLGREASFFFNSMKQMQGFKLDIDFTKLENSLEVVTKEAKTAFNTLTDLKKAKLDLDITAPLKKLDLLRIGGRQLVEQIEAAGKKPLDIKTGNTEQKVAAVAKSVKQLATEKERLGAATKRSEEHFRLLNTTLGNVANQFLFVRRVIIAFAGVNLGGRIIETVAAFDRLNQSMKAVFQNQAGQELDFVRQTADRLGLSVTDLATNWAKFAASVDPTKVSMAQMRENFLAVAEAGSRLGLSTEEINGTLVALSQIASKGRLSMEELRQQLGDRLPGAVRIAAEALGVTQAKLFALIEQGKIGSDVFLNAFPKALRASFGTDQNTRIETIGAAIVRLQNAFKELLNAAVRSGALEAFTRIINDLATKFKDPAFISSMQDLANAIAKIAVAAIGAAKPLAILLAGFIAFKTFRGITDGITALTVSLVNFTSSIGKATGIMSAFVPTATSAAQVAKAGAANFAGWSSQVVAFGRVLLATTGIVGALAAAYVALNAVAEKFVDSLISTQEKANAVAEALREAASNDRLAKLFNEQAAALQKFSEVSVLTTEQVKALTQEQAQLYKQGAEGAEELATAQEKAAASAIKSAQERIKFLQLDGENTAAARQEIDSLIVTISQLRDQQAAAAEKAAGLAKALEDVANRGDASGRAIIDNADAINRLIVGADKAGKLGEQLQRIDLTKLSKDAKGIITAFNDAREKGDDFAKALEKAVPKNWLDGAQKDLSDTTNAIAALIQEGLIPASVAADELAKDLSKLDADKIAAFGVRAQAAFELATVSAQALDLMLESQLRASMNKLGVDAEFAGKNINKAFAELTSNFANLAGNVKATGAQIKEGLDISIAAAKSKEELQLLKSTIENLGLASGKFATELEDSLLRLDDKIRLMGATLNSALGDSFQRLGIQSKAMLTAMADQAVVDFNRIKTSGMATALELESAFRKMAEEITKLNNGIPPLSLKFGAMDNNAFDVLVAMAEKASARIKKAIQDAIPLADTKEKLRLLAEGIEFAFDRGRISINEFKEVMFTVGQALREAVARPMGEVLAVVEKFGFQTRDMLKATADNAREAFDVMRFSGEFTTQELAKGAQLYLDAYKAANDGVVDSFDPVVQKALEVVESVNGVKDSLLGMKDAAAPIDTGSLRDKTAPQLQLQLDELTKAYRAIGVQNVQDLQIIQEIQKEIQRQALLDAEARRKAIEEASTVMVGAAETLTEASDRVQAPQQQQGVGGGLQKGGLTGTQGQVKGLGGDTININLNGSGTITADEVKRKVVPALNVRQLRRR